jgi:hypothetical protein
MHDQPSVSELVQAVKNFVDNTAAPNLTGHAAFHARVASNVLATILRDLEARPDNDAAELARLSAILNSDGDLETLNRKLCFDIQSGAVNAETAGLLDHLKATAIAQVKVDQPKYSGLKTATD